MLTEQEAFRIECLDDAGLRWSSIGVSSNVIYASFNALYDSITYKLHKDSGAIGKRSR